MVTRAAVDEFMAGKTLAVAGVSRKRGKFASVIWRELRKRDYRVFPVTPNAETIDDEPCYAGPGALPEPVDGVIVCVNRKRTLEIVRECIEAGVPRLWIQPESRSDEAVRLAEEAGVPTIHGECIFMYAAPVGFIHRVHRGIRSLLGRMPK